MVKVGVVYDVPVPKEDPPLDAAYQFKVPALAVAPKFTVPASQREAGAVLETLGIELTSIVTVAVLLHVLTSVPVTV